MSVCPDDEPDSYDEQLFAWAIVVPVLLEHHAITVVVGEAVSGCACSPAIRRTTQQWARHVSDEIARRIS